MNFFECCRICKPPKRYPGCSGPCPDYAKARAKFDACKEAERKRSQVSSAKTDYLNNAVWHSKNH